MKRKILIILLIIILIIIVGIILLKRNKPTNISKIKSFSFFYTQGYAVNASINYELTCDNNKCQALIKQYGVPYEEATTIDVDKKVEEKLIEIIEKYEVNKWDGFSKTNKNALDGDSFSINIKMEDDNSISASGYMSWPQNYGKVREELDNLFTDIYNNK